MSRRQREGDETWSSLNVWTRGQKAAERLAAQILRVEGYSSIDPSHPLGGRDGLKDLVCTKNNMSWIGAAYFPRNQKTLKEITKKFSDDLKGAQKNKAGGFAFISNQEISLGGRRELKKLASKYKADLDLFHLERIAHILDSPPCYGIRLEFLDIEMTKEEQLAFIAVRDAVIDGLQSQLERIVTHLESSPGLKDIPVNEIKEFKGVLDSIAGYDPFAGLLTGSMFGRGGHVKDLQVPLRDLQEFEQILRRIVRVEGPLSGLMYSGLFSSPAVQDLKVPLDELKEYERALDRVSNKLRGFKLLKAGTES
jgi:hypothetical protein